MICSGVWETSLHALSLTYLIVPEMSDTNTPSEEALSTTVDGRLQSLYDLQLLCDLFHVGCVEESKARADMLIVFIDRNLIDNDGQGFDRPFQPDLKLIRKFNLWEKPLSDSSLLHRKSSAETSAVRQD